MEEAGPEREPDNRLGTGDSVYLVTLFIVVPAMVVILVGVL
jgi:hypothetical protein